MEQVKYIDNKKIENGDYEYSDGIILMPKELEKAPEEIRQAYVDWFESGKVTKFHPNRFFKFINRDGEEDQVDCLGLPGRVQQLARDKGISDEDYSVMDSIVMELQSLKAKKTSLSWKWRKWLRPHLGKDIFDWKRAEIIDMFARYMTLEDVKSTLEKDGYIVNSVNLNRFFLNNKDIIDKKRLEFLRTVKDMYLATDAGRMETLAVLHHKLITIFNELGQKQPQTQAIRQEMKSISSEIRGVLEQARKEIKGDEIKLTVDGRIDVNASIEASRSIAEVSKKIPLHIIPVYMVAAKKGISPHLILTSLVNSFYRDWNGFSGNVSDKKPPLTNDLIRNYDWNEIQQYHSEHIDKDEELSDYEEIKDEKKDLIKSKRELLIDIIRNKQV